MTPSQALPAVLAQIDADLDQSLERLFAFLRIQSISTDPAYKAQCLDAAQYVAQDLTSIGFETSVRPTAARGAAHRAFCSTATMTFSRLIRLICGRHRRLHRASSPEQTAAR